jgi:hypothetical protein
MAQNWGRKKAPKEGQAFGKVSRRLLAFKNDSQDKGQGSVDHWLTSMNGDIL